MSTSARDAELDEGLRALARIASRTGVFCDFDGSLSPIVDDPERARAVRGAGRALHALARHFAVVAVVSGRPVSFLTRRLHARGVRLFGIYGIEERVGRTLKVLPEVSAARASVDRAAQRLRRDLGGEQGVFVEHKGLAVSVHFRRARDPDGAMARAESIVDAAAAEEGLAQTTRGRLVLEVGPRVSVDKGEVVRSLIASNSETAGQVELQREVHQRQQVQVLQPQKLILRKTPLRSIPSTIQKKKSILTTSHSS